MPIMTGIAAGEKARAKVVVYPNPSQEELYIYYHNPKQPYAATFRIWNMQGQEIVGRNALTSGTTYILPVRDWASGVYFVQVQDEKGNVYTEKFIKE